MHRGDKLLELVEAIYEAGCDPAGWQRVADMCCARVPGSAFSQLVAVPRRFESPIPVTCGWPPEALQTYAAYYHTINPYPALLSPFPPGQVILAGKVVDPRWQARQAFFNEWAKPAGDFTGGASLTLQRTADSYTRLTFDIPERYRRREPCAGQILERIGPHVLRALEMNARADAAALSRGISDALLEALDEAALVVDAAGRIRAQNSKAEALLRDGRIVTAAAGRLAFRSPRAGETFRAALAATVAIAAAAGPQAFAAEGEPRGGSRVLVLPLASPRAGFATTPAARLALVLVDAGNKAAGLAEHVLRLLYGLTSAELRVVLAIAAGDALEEIADRHAISRATARNQLASATRKLGVRRQSELVALVARLAPRVGTGG